MALPNSLIPHPQTTPLPPSRHFDVAILQPGYLPWLGYFDQAALADVFVFFDDVQYVRHTWRNRNRVLNDQTPGWRWLTVPVRGDYQAPIRDIQVADSRWVKKHLRAIGRAYQRAPFFDFCYPVLERYLTTKTWTSLLDLCVQGHLALCELLDIHPATRFSSDLGHAGTGRQARPVLLCRDLGATRFIAGDASRDYNDDALFREAGIELVYQAYPHPSYAQFREPFISHLSVVDALMFAGPGTRSWAGISHSKTHQPHQPPPGLSAARADAP